MSQEIVYVIREKDGPIHVTPPLTVRSGFVSERICKLSCDANESQRFLKNLQRVQDNAFGLVDLFYVMDIIQDVAEANHLRQHWFPDEWPGHGEGAAEPYWPEYDVKKILVNGLEEAFRTATELKFSVYMCWLVQGMQYDPTVPVTTVVDSEIMAQAPIQSVLFMIVTPPPNEKAPGN